MAAPATLGVYFDGLLHTTPAPATPFNGYLVLVQSDYFVTAVEYQLVVSNPNFVLLGTTYPANFSIENGDALAGHSIAYWPPMTGYPEGYDVLATYNCMILQDCAVMPNTTLEIGPNPASGELRGTYSPDNDFLPIIGLTSFVCPDGVATESKSWGAIKSLVD